MLDDTLPVTLQYQLRSKLLEQIEKKNWPPGYKIPSESELCNIYGVSRITVREVLKDLVQEGYLIRKQGKGTFVFTPKFEPKLISYYSLSQEIEEKGLQSEFRILEFYSYRATSFLQETLGLSPEDCVYEIIRLRLIGDELFAWEKSTVPCSLLEGATKEQVAKYGLYPTILSCSGLAADEAEEDFEAVNCPDKIAKLLGLKKNTAVLHITRLTKSQGKCIEYCESFIHGEKYKYKHVLRRKKAAPNENITDSNPL
jgi:GntR family transcriptional regulator